MNLQSAVHSSHACVCVRKSVLLETMQGLPLPPPLTQSSFLITFEDSTGGPGRSPVTGVASPYVGGGGGSAVTSGGEPVLL